MRKSLSPFFLLLFLLPLPLLADTTYTYTGNPFTFAVSPYTTSNFVSGSFTVVGGPLSCSAGCTFTPLSFNFSDGMKIESNNTASVITFFIFTGGDGSIMYWGIQLQDAGAGQIRTYNYNSVVDDGALTGNSYAYNVEQGGSWSTSTVPEPSSLILLGSGLAGLAGVIRRKLKR